MAKLDCEAIGVQVLKSEIGDIGEFDVKLALATQRVTIVGFKVGIDAAAREMIRAHGSVRVITGEVIYELIDAVKKNLVAMIPPEIKRTPLGRAKILKIFKREAGKQIIGGRVEEGVVERDSKVDISRMKNIIGTGAVVQLQHNKSAAESVEQGSEFGMMLDARTAVQEGDVLEIFHEEIIKKGLE